MQRAASDRVMEPGVRRAARRWRLELAVMLALSAGTGTSADGGTNGHLATAAMKRSAAPSGIYGFAGARSDDNDPQGVIGECIWIFDQDNKAQVAKGSCSEAQPGQFHVKLKPGKYVVHGPGGNRAIEVKQGQWVKVVSIVPVPVAF
jgi:hypothetical protein